MTKEQINFLASSFGRHEKITVEAYEKLASILDRADDASLATLYRANIRFVSKLALNRMVKRSVAEYKKQYGDAIYTS